MQKENSLSNHNFFNAHHAPIGAFASFTLGFPGASGGLGLELGGPAQQNICIAAETHEAGTFEALPFCEGNDSGEEERAHFNIEGAIETPMTGVRSRIKLFAQSEIRRDFKLGTDSWSAGDLTFTVYSQARGVPDPDVSTDDELREALLPAVLAELTLDNSSGKNARRVVFGYGGNDPYSGMRHVGETLPGFTGIGQGRLTAIVSDDPQARSGVGFSINSILDATPVENLTFGLGGAGAILGEVPAGERKTFRFAICFYRDGMATAGLDASYFYTRLFKNIEETAKYALDHFDALKTSAIESNALVEQSRLSSDQKFMLAHSIRSYFGSVQFLAQDGKPLWVVNEGEYRMMNTFDLTVDQLFFELKMNPWTVRNELDLFTSRYSYQDTVSFPGEKNQHPGGLSFTHDMGVSNTFSRPGYSSYEQYQLKGCFSYMTHEQLVNWLCCATVYVVQTGDFAWRDANLPIFEACFQSMLNRDHPDPAQRNGVMSLDSSRTMGGAEITTYDSLDVSLGQARGNIYLAGKCWSCYVALEKLFGECNLPELAKEAGLQAERCAGTLVRNVTPEGYIPAVIGEGNDSKIIPAIEGLVFPFFNGCPEALATDGRFGELVQALRNHLKTVLVPGVCLFPDGGWKLSSTSDNSWLSKIYLCQFVARHILGDSDSDIDARADSAHVAWLLDERNAFFSWSDQIFAGLAVGSKYYPRGVTSVLWLLED